MELTHLQLGRSVGMPESPEQAQLDIVPNPHKDTDYFVRFTAPEFTSLCPVTGQPDFAIMVMDYVPGEHLIESKSLKLFLGSYRNHAGFHEGCTVEIGKRLCAALNPKFFSIGGYWYPRGGMPIDVFWQYGVRPNNVWIPPQEIPTYRGR